MMLGLLAPTDPAWVDAVEGDLAALLVDHAHCELKAAQSALSLLGRWAGARPELVMPLVLLAQEETEHFRQVEAHARARGATIPPPARDDYVLGLRDAARESAKGTPPLLDRLLVCALIEARSCERFQVLAERLSDGELRAFYRDLMASEARHYRLFVRLAEEAHGVAAARERLTDLAAREAEVVRGLPLGPTVHG